MIIKVCYCHSGLGAAVTVFDEEEIVAGDLVKVELDPDVFKMMHEAAGLWNDKMAGVNLCMCHNCNYTCAVMCMVITYIAYASHK